MFGEHVIVAVVVEHPRFGPMRTRRDHHVVVGDQSAVLDLVGRGDVELGA
jgi:hypothetical protein